MPLSPILLPATCDVYRPFGAGAATATGSSCRLRPDMARGTTRSGLVWTHVLDVQPDVDIQDGCTRTAGSDAVVFGDGDEIRDADGARYVVVWVETVGVGTPLEHR